MQEPEPHIRSLPTTMVVDAFPLEDSSKRAPAPEPPGKRSIQ